MAASEGMVLGTLVASMAAFHTAAAETNNIGRVLASAEDTLRLCDEVDMWNAKNLCGLRLAATAGRA